MPKLSATILLVLCALAAYSSTPNWKLKKEESGIKIYTAHSDSSAVKLIRVELVVEATAEQLIAFMLDIPKQPEWLYNCETAHLLERIAPNEVTFYAEVALPWPASNRDYCTHMTITQKQPGHATIHSFAVPNCMPAKPGKVRLKKSVAHWEIMPISATEIKIVYELNTDPGGSMPAWVTNLFIAKGPIASFQKVREIVRRPEYKNADLPFLN